MQTNCENESIQIEWIKNCESIHLKTESIVNLFILCELRPLLWILISLIMILSLWKISLFLNCDTNARTQPLGLTRRKMKFWQISIENCQKIEFNKPQPDRSKQLSEVGKGEEPLKTTQDFSTWISVLIFVKFLILRAYFSRHVTIFDKYRYHTPTLVVPDSIPLLYRCRVLTYFEFFENISVSTIAYF